MAPCRGVMEPEDILNKKKTGQGARHGTGPFVVAVDLFGSSAAPFGPLGLICYPVIRIPVTWYRSEGFGIGKSHVDRTCLIFRAA